MTKWADRKQWPTWAVIAVILVPLAPGIFFLGGKFNEGINTKIDGRIGVMDAPMVQMIDGGFDHAEELQEQKDGFDRCRSRLIGAQHPRDQVDRMCGDLFPPVGHTRREHIEQATGEDDGN